MSVRYGHPHERKSTRMSDESILKQTQTGPVGGCSGKESLQTTAIEDKNSLRSKYYSDPPISQVL